MHTDIKIDGWINKIPKSWRPYIVLARLDRPIGIWLLLWPSWWAIVLASGGLKAMNVQGWALAGLFALGAIVMRAAGCVINDLWDRDLDARVKRTRLRPLASGNIASYQALLFLGSLLLLGLLILMQMNAVTIFLGLCSMPLVIVYPLMKRWTYWPQAVLGLTFNMGALMGWSAVTGSVSGPALALYGAGLFWTLAYDTIYAHQDKEDDALIGIRSTALRFQNRPKLPIIVFYGFFYLCLALALVLASKAIPVLSFIFWAMAVLYTAWIWRRWQPEDAQSCLSTFKANQNLGLLIVLCCALV